MTTNPKSLTDDSMYFIVHIAPPVWVAFSEETTMTSRDSFFRMCLALSIVVAITIAWIAQKMLGADEQIVTPVQATQQDE